MSDIEALGVDEVPTILVVPLMFAGSSAVEECILLLQTLVATSRGKTGGVIHRVCFWTCNAEGPWIRGVENVIEEGCLSLVGASVWGMVRSASLEIDHNLLRVVCVDTDESHNVTLAFNQVLMELSNSDNSKEGDDEVAYRNKSRFVRRLQRIDNHTIGVVEPEHQNEPNIGVALVTGGLGGLGLVTAELLHELGAEHIVLVSRSGKAKNYPGQHLEERMARLLDGEGVSIECCDMSSEDEVQSLLERVRVRHGEINTIVHASGVLHDSLLPNMTAEKVRSSFGAKAAGAWHLHEGTSSDDIRRFIMFSSIAALFGNPGQTNYSASNSYLDSLARLRQQRGLPAVSIQWPAIADVGMAVASEKNLNKSNQSSIS
jgi:NADP-dependent 3-hydroxy acid dehydrogenase YdfG